MFENPWLISSSHKHWPIEREQEAPQIDNGLLWGLRILQGLVSLKISRGQKLRTSTNGALGVLLGAISY